MQPLLEVIDKYMICTMGRGNIDDQGHQIIRVRPSADGCPDKKPVRTSVQLFYLFICSSSS